MKIAFFGTPEFAGNILSGILEYSEIKCKLVVSQPDKAVGRKQILESTAVKKVAIEKGIHVMQPKYLSRSLSSHERDQAARDFHQYLKDLDLDFIVVVAYGKIIPKDILDIPKYGCINIHGSILPKYRGASPVQAVIKSGSKETGLTTMYMSEAMDEGDILQIAKVIIDNVDTSEDIFKKFVQIGPDLLISTLQGIVSGNLKGVSQEESEATYCGKISREDAEVFFQKQAAQEIYDTFRAFTPWPGIYTWYEGKRFVLEDVAPFQMPLSILSGEEIQSGRDCAESGKFLKLEKNRYGIVCSDGKILEIIRVKLEGKKSMDAVSFVNGNREVVGYQFQ